MSKSRLENFSSSRSNMPLIPPVVQVLSPDAITPQKSLSSDTYLRDPYNDGNKDSSVLSLRGDIHSLNDKVTQTILKN